MSTYMEIVEADDANPNTIKEPAKRWRNWYVCKQDGYLARDLKRLFNSGDIYHGWRTYPSKDAAETDAALQPGALKCEARDWIGAFPEGERP